LSLVEIIVSVSKSGGLTSRYSPGRIMPVCADAVLWKSSYAGFYKEGLHVVGAGPGGLGHLRTLNRNAKLVYNF